MNYSTLTTNIKNFLEDDSTEFDTSIDQIIDQAESMIFQRLPNLPCYRSTATGNLVVGTSEYTIANARMVRNFAVTVSSEIFYLDHRVDSYLKDYWPNSSTTGTPIMFSIKSATTSGTVMVLAPTPDATLAYSVDYIAPITGLSSSNTTNWIGDNAENVLLSACLYESSAFLKAPETVTLYKSQFDEAAQLMQQEMLRDRTIEYNGGI
jgi:hypothetical protein